MQLTANMVTIARIVLMPIPGYLLYGEESELLAALMLIIVIGLTDWLDGIMARREGPSVLGGLLDPIADKIFIAVIYLPLTEQGIVPIWMTACILSRDFVVTGLRTALSLRNAPMRTSTLAKYKTAMQMVGIGYVILYEAFFSNPDSPWVFFFIIAPIAMPVALILVRLIKKRKQGRRSATMAALMTIGMLVRVILGPDFAVSFTLWVVTGITVISGFSYLVDAWTALFRKTGFFGEGVRLLVDGVLVPVLFVALIDRAGGGIVSVAIILVITVELGLGGLCNLLASRNTAPPYHLMLIKSLIQIALAGAALTFSLTPATTGWQIDLCILSAAVVTCLYAGMEFWRKRTYYHEEKNQ